MFDEHYWNVAAEYMAKSRPDIFKDVEDARSTLDRLADGARNSGWASTGGFTVTYNEDDGFGEYEVLKNIVSVWSSDEENDLVDRGFVWLDRQTSV